MFASLPTLHGRICTLKKAPEGAVVELSKRMHSWHVQV